MYTHSSTRRKTDRYEGISLKINQPAFLEKDVGFVKKNNAVPNFTRVKDRLKIFLNPFSPCADIIVSDAVERLFCNFGDAFGGESLASPLAAMEKHDKPITFATD